MSIRNARHSDLPAIVRMLADDALGATREAPSEPLADSYLSAFAAIERDPNIELVVIDLGEGPIAVLQLTLTPHITHRGGWRATIEGVRVDARNQGRGVGHQLLRWAIERARERGCHQVQLTTDKQRVDAQRFYLSLGFVTSHEGMKLKLC